MKKLFSLLILLAGMSQAQTTVAPFLNSEIQLLDNNGAVCSGCFLDTFAAGTTTPLVTYSESTGTTPNANPIVLSSAGRATVYLTSASYKFRLRSAAGVTLWTQDQISWATPLSTFAGISDAGNFTQTQPTAATGGANQSSFNDCMNGNYWTGSVSATDQWCLQDVLGTGSNPTSTFTLTHSGSSGAASVSIPSAAVSLGAALILGTGLGNIKLADAATSGADWCAKVMTQDAALGSTAGEIWVDQSAGTSACASGITLSDNHIVKFTQPGTYTIGTVNTVPGNHSGFECTNEATIISYTGTGYLFDVPVASAVTEPIFWGCQIQLNASPAGGIRTRSKDNTIETRARIKAVVSASVRTSGQVGVLLQADNATSSNYHGDYDVQTRNIDIGAKLVSLVNNQGPNANNLKVSCNGQSKCVAILDGTDSSIKYSALGGASNPIAVELCGTGNGGYGANNNTITASIGEQGAGSTTIKINSGAGLTVGCGGNKFDGGTNDSTQITDSSTASGLSKNSWWLTTQANLPNLTGELLMTEISAPSGIASRDQLWADSSAHRWKMINNNGTAAQVVASGVDVNTSDQVTATHLASPLPTAQGGTGQNSTAVFPTSGTVPNVAGSVDLTGQTAAIGTTNVNSGTLAAGQYLLTFNAKVTTAAGTSSTLGAVTVSYTDPDGVSLAYTATELAAAGGTITSNSGNTTTAALIGIPMLLNVKASTNVTIAVAYASNPANAMTYNFHAKLQAMQ